MPMPVTTIPVIEKIMQDAEHVLKTINLPTGFPQNPKVERQGIAEVPADHGLILLDHDDPVSIDPVVGAYDFAEWMMTLVCVCHCRVSVNADLHIDTLCHYFRSAVENKLMEDRHRSVLFGDRFAIDSRIIAPEYWLSADLAYAGVDVKCSVHFRTLAEDAFDRV